MPNHDDDAVTVTLAEIARIAGVGRAAVSNWRRRHPDFPSATGGSDTSPQFSLDDVETWLREHGRLSDVTGASQRLWPRFEALGERDAMARILSALGSELSGRRLGPDLSSEMTKTDHALLKDARALAEREGAAKTFTYLFDRWLGTHIRQVATTPPALADLITEVAILSGARTVRNVMDPACGTGSLLLAAANRWGSGTQPALLGQELDPALASLAAARIALQTNSEARIEVGDTLRADAFRGVRAEVVLCSLPTNQRDWGYDDLSTDPRWGFGLPPRTESELAWVQHAVSALADDGVAVLLLPPSVAARRAGRRIRAGLLRSGALQAVIALPVGSAPPYAISPHLWVLTAPNRRPDADVLMVDASDARTQPTSGRPAVDWDTVRMQVKDAWRQGDKAHRTRRVPLIELLDDQVDLSPGRHLPTGAGDVVAELRAEWVRLEHDIRQAGALRQTLSTLALNGDATTSSRATLGELERAGALRIVAGRNLRHEDTSHGTAPSDALPLLTQQGMADGEDEQPWIVPTPGDDELPTVERGDVVMVGTTRAFDVRIHDDGPAALASPLLALRVAPDKLDPWYLAGCLRAPGNAQRAGGHASASSRVDPRRLAIPRLPLEDQRRLGDVFRQVAELERTLDRLRRTGTSLSRTLSGLAAEGRL